MSPHEAASLCHSVIVGVAGMPRPGRTGLRGALSTQPSALQPAWRHVPSRGTQCGPQRGCRAGGPWVMAEGISVWGPQFIQSTFCAQHGPHHPFPGGLYFPRAKALQV